MSRDATLAIMREQYRRVDGLEACFVEAGCGPAFVRLSSDRVRRYLRS